MLPGEGSPAVHRSCRDRQRPRVGGMESSAHGRHPTHDHLPAQPHHTATATPGSRARQREGDQRNAAWRHARGAGSHRLALPLALMLLPIAQPFLGAPNSMAFSGVCGLRTSSFLPLSRSLLAPDPRPTSNRRAAFPLPLLADPPPAARQGAAGLVCRGYGWHLVRRASQNPVLGVMQA